MYCNRGTGSFPLRPTAGLNGQDIDGEDDGDHIDDDIDGW